MATTTSTSGHDAARRSLAAVLCTLVLGGAGGLATIGWASPRAQTLIAVYPPWWPPARIWSAALSVGEISDVGGASFVLVIHSAGPNAPGRAARSGAVFTLDPGALGPCGSTTKDTL